MCRAERIIDDAKIREEIDVYGALLPGPGELSATLFIEIADKDQIKPVLDSSWASTPADTSGSRSGRG